MLRAFRKMGKIMDIRKDFEGVLEGCRKGEKKALGRVVELFSDENEETSSSFFEFMVETGEPAVKPLIEALAICKNRESLNLMRALGEIGDPRAIYALAVKLRDKDPQVRGEAALALGKIRHPKAVKVLVRALKDKSFVVRRNAARALGEIRSRKAVDALIKALGDKDWQVRSAAAWALGEIRDPKAVIPLTKRLRDRDKDVVVKTVDALRALGDPRAVKALVDILKEKGEIRYKAVWALGEIGDPTALEPVVKALKDPDWRVQKRASWAVKRITGRQEEKDEPDIEL